MLDKVTRFHDWQKKYAEGALGERILDGLFVRLFEPTLATPRGLFGDLFMRNWQQGMELVPASRDEQRRGIDRFFSGLTVEYKTDDAAGSTGNAFIETVSVDSAGKPGWAYTAQAEVLVYYVPDRELVLVLRFETLRHQLPIWEGSLPRRRVQNKDYRAEGMLLPLADLERLADVVIRL